MKSYLVTGGFGFIGGHLIELLLDDPGVERVHVVDDLSTSPLAVKDFVSALPDPTRLSFDLCSVADFYKSDPERFDGTYHLASPVGPAGVLKHSGEMIRSIVNDAYLVIDHCVVHGTKLLDVSTSEVYGGGQEGYCSENAQLIVPPGMTVRLEYALAKLAVESAIINSVRPRSLRAVVVRPFNVAGPRQSPTGGFVLPRFIRQAHANQPLTVFGTGRAVRAFTHVRDMANGLRLAMNHGESGGIYNVGNPDNKISIRELAELVLDVTGSKSEIRHVDPKEIFGETFEEANDKFPAAERAFSVLGWVPQFDTRRIVEDTYRDYLAQLERGIEQPMSAAQ